jgi:hypothetical protein
VGGLLIPPPCVEATIAERGLSLRSSADDRRNGGVERAFDSSLDAVASIW